MRVIWRTRSARGTCKLGLVFDSHTVAETGRRADPGRNLSDEDDEEVVRVKSVKGKGKANAEGKGKKQAE